MIERLTVQPLKAAFSQLNSKQRKTFEMFFFEGLTFTEIAERLNEDVKNLRHHYYRGLERLRQRFRALGKRGVCKDLAAQTAGSPHGPWRIGNSPALTIAV